LITYSGISDQRIEPVDSNIAVESLLQAFSKAKTYRVILYWRPIVPGLNDSDAHLQRAIYLSRHAHATVFTGLFYREEIKQFFAANNIPDLYPGTARRKILPRKLENRIIRAFEESEQPGILFRKTSCAVAYAHKTFDYNGHFGIKELCDICPRAQVGRCREKWRIPDSSEVDAFVHRLGGTNASSIDSRAAYVTGIDEQRRYFIQHSLGYQIHDRRHPHHLHRHGRADIGWDSVKV
jgi:hypothetical protein